GGRDRVGRGLGVRPRVAVPPGRPGRGAAPLLLALNSSAVHLGAATGALFGGPLADAVGSGWPLAAACGTAGLALHTILVRREVRSCRILVRGHEAGAPSSVSGAHPDAEAYPRVSVAGSHAESIGTAREWAAEAGVADRVRFQVATAQTFTGGYELVT